MQDLLIYCVLFVSIPIESSVIFWQNSPGNFARIHRGGPGQQAGGLNNPVAIIREQKNEQLPPDQFSNNLHPFVHFAANDVTALDTNNQLIKEQIQFPFSNTVSRAGKLFQLESDDITEEEDLRRKTQFIEENIKKSSELSSRIKILLRKKLEKLLPQLHQVKKKSEVELGRKKDKSPSSFLDNLIEHLNSKKLGLSKESENSNGLDDGLMFFKTAGLVKKKLARQKFDTDSNESIFEDKDFEKLLKEVGLPIKKKLDHHNDSDVLNPFHSFLEEEENKVETEREILSQEVSEFFHQLQGKQVLLYITIPIHCCFFSQENRENEENEMKKAKIIIASKLRKFPVEYLVQVWPRHKVIRKLNSLYH